ncbi:MAG: type II toxin-antitoxin system VapC family toxin [Actinomycetes bacterium]
MSIYLDTSALAKLVFAETESAALRHTIAEYPQHVTSALSEVELMRVAHRATTEHVTKAREVLAALNIITLGPAVLRSAGNLLPGSLLRSLDAIHLAAASATPSLEYVITYDHRTLDSAQQLGIACLTPGCA